MNLRQGQLVQHEQHPNEVFTIDHFEGDYPADIPGFRWKVWLRSVDVLAHIPFPANAAELRPVTKH